MERRPIVAGNWKMNTTLDEARDLIGGLLAAPGDSERVERVVMPPFPWIVPVAELTAGSDIGVGAQDCAVEDQGAFTGEVSARMLAPYCRYVIVGHSERRHIIGESDELVAGKLAAALRNGLSPVLCVGELLEERERGEARAVVERQLRAAAGALTAARMARAVIAYEPVWAIGTGRAATPGDAQEMAAFIREMLRELADEETSRRVRIQYGGSVNAGNAADFFTLPDIDGALVGGASLKADEFLGIIAAARDAGGSGRPRDGIV